MRFDFAEEYLGEVFTAKKDNLNLVDVLVSYERKMKANRK